MRPFSQSCSDVDTTSESRVNRQHVSRHWLSLEQAGVLSTKAHTHFHKCSETLRPPALAILGCKPFQSILTLTSGNSLAPAALGLRVRRHLIVTVRLPLGSSAERPANDEIHGFFHKSIATYCILWLILSVIGPFSSCSSSLCQGEDGITARRVSLPKKPM